MGRTPITTTITPRTPVLTEKTFVLLESLDFLLQEDGGKILLEESGDNWNPRTPITTIIS